MTTESHIQFWEAKNPSRKDALIILALTLDLLSEALPVAMDLIGTRSVEVQENFWHAYFSFQRETDIGLVALDETVSRTEGIAMRLVEWSELAQTRIEDESEPLEP